MRLLTIDSSVFVSRTRAREVGHPESAAFLQWVRATRPRLFIPTLAIPEVAAALSRTGSDREVAHSYALAIGSLPNTVLVALDDGVAQQAAALAAQHRLRGADAVFVAAAALFAAELVTLDSEQLERGAAVVQTHTPQTFLATTTP
jgi:predicted nucleic acid-binding protein